jgi:hypothetical protein
MKCDRRWWNDGRVAREADASWEAELKRRGIKSWLWMGFDGGELVVAPIYEHSLAWRLSGEEWP